MDWFERITGFAELPYEQTQRRLSVVDGRLVSQHTARTWPVGRLETPSLAELRQRAVAASPPGGKTRVSCIQADVRQLHGAAASRSSLFQVASQFNLLEMVGPDVTPEHGVTAYVHDRTQGPACAIAAGAGTVFRNYLADVGGQVGQRANRQIDCLRDVGAALGNADGSLWQMQNGYALCTDAGLSAIDARLRAMAPGDLDELRGRLRIGLHWNVEVTDAGDPGQLVSQAYCSALPVAYSRLPQGKWRHFATLVLEAAYEATMLAAVLNAAENGSGTVFLTRLGGGAFGNDFAWIDGAMARAIDLVRHRGLDVRIVSYGPIPQELNALAASFGN